MTEKNGNRKNCLYWYIKVDYETKFLNYCSAVTTYSSSSVWSISSPEQQVAVGVFSEAKKKKRRFPEREIQNSEVFFFSVYNF